MYWEELYDRLKEENQEAVLVDSSTIKFPFSNIKVYQFVDEISGFANGEISEIIVDGYEGREEEIDIIINRISDNEISLDIKMKQ